MATLSSTMLTIAELAKRTNNGNVLSVAEILRQTNQIMVDAVWVEANGFTGHTGSIRQSLPSGTWGKINSGLTKESSEVKQVTEAIGILEGRSEIDIRLLDISKDKQMLRDSENAAYVEGMSQNFATTFIYGNTDVYPERFDGLAPRLNDLSYGNVIGNGGTGSDLSSIYIVQWGINKTHFIYPMSSSVGIGVEYMGKEKVYDSDSKPFYADVTNFKMAAGLFVHDPRSIIRIANIETDATDSNSFKYKNLVKALRLLPDNGVGAVIYANGTILEQMDLDVIDKSNVMFSPGDPYGVPVGSFRGVPVRQVSAILDTESAVS